MTAKRVTHDELQALRRFIEERDAMAQKIGVATYEHLLFIETARRRITESLDGEKRAKTEILLRYGIQPGSRAEVDLETGLIVEG